MNMEQAKIAVIGCGNVGTTIAHSLVMKDVATEIILIDVDEKKARGNALDLEDTLFFSNWTGYVDHNDYALAAQADIIILCAGIAQKPGQSRLDLLETNKSILQEITQKLNPLNPNALVIIVTNPVDILTWYAQQWLPLPKNQIFGSGTYIDSVRFMNLIGKKIGANPQNIYAYVLGEHGDTQVPIWSSVFVDGTPIDEYRSFLNKSHTPLLSQKDKDEISDAVKNRAYEIIADKGNSTFGIAACVTSMCQAIVFSALEMPASSYQEKYGVCMSAMATIGPKGVGKHTGFEISESEERLLELSAQQIKKYLI